MSQNNDDILTKIKNYENHKDSNPNKFVVLLEFTNEHFKNKVHNMELSNDDLKEKIRILKQEKEELKEKLSAGTSDLEKEMKEDREQMEMQLSLMRQQLEQKFVCEASQLRDKVASLTEIKASYERQVRQIEENNSAMQMKLAAVQQERDAARKETDRQKEEKQALQKTHESSLKIMDEQKLELETGKIKIQELTENLDQEVITKLTFQAEVEPMNNNLANLQKQIADLNETRSFLTSELETAATYKTQLEETAAKYSELKKQQEKTISELQSSAATEPTDAQTHNKIKLLTLEKDKMAAKLKEVETEKKKMAEELKMSKSVFEKTKSELRIREEEVNVVRDRLKEVQDKLHLETVISGENNNDGRVRELEEQLRTEKESHKEQLRHLASEYENKITSKQLECNVSLASALEHQDNEINLVVRQQRESLRSSQEEAKEKTAALDALKTHSETIIKYEDQLATLRSQHQAQLRELESTWKARAESLMKKKETDFQGEMDNLQQEWNKERKELEKLTQVAAAAFRSGTDSVELLKKQVSSQRKEIDEIKKNHKKEMSELQALLEIKRRRGRGVPTPEGNLRLGVGLEEAAEFEYLRNVLYQYMIGKETLTLAKVLCAVVKFDVGQQTEILEQEERKQSMELENKKLPKKLVLQERYDPSKTL